MEKMDDGGWLERLVDDGERLVMMTDGLWMMADSLTSHIWYISGRCPLMDKMDDGGRLVDDGGRLDEPSLPGDWK